MSTPPEFEWTVIEQESEWQALNLPPAQLARQITWRRWRSPWRWILVALLLLSFALEHMAQAKSDKIEAELQSAVAADAWATQPHTTWLSSTEVPAVQVMQVEVHNDQAVVQTVITQTLASGKTVAYQATELYRQSAAGWVRTAPATAELGPLQSLTTQYFTIRYYQVDAPVVHKIAPRLDALYAQACANFGVSPTMLAQPILLELVMDSQQEMGLVVDSMGESIVLPSPLLLRLPLENSTEEWLYQAAAEPLVQSVIKHAAPELNGADQHFRWQPLLDALQLWQAWQAGGALAEQRPGVLRQFYGATDPFSSFATCQMPTIWQLATPIVMTLCNELAILAAQTAAGPSGLQPPRKLAMLALSDRDMSNPRPWGEMAALESLVEYVVATYSVERLPVLLHALDSNDNWTDLVQTVYRISTEEFEQGWQAYMVQHYACQASHCSIISPDLPRIYAGIVQ